MANTLTITGLLPDIYVAQDQVARELSGGINSATINSGTEAAAENQTVSSMRSAKPTLNTSYTPAMTIPAGDDQTLGAESMTLDKVANVRIPLTGEVVKGLNSSVGGEYARRQMLAQAFRVITNQIESDLLAAAYKGASRAYGTAGTTPFATTFSEIAQLRKILADNGCPMSDLQLSLVLNTSAGANLRSLAQLQKVNEAGSADLLRQGELLNLQGFSLKESAGVATHTKGTATGQDCTAVEPIGENTISVDGADSGTILEGDIITFAGDSNKYVVKSSTASGAASGNIVINYPGLLAASTIGQEITIGDSYAANVGFHRSAIELAMRPPAMPDGGDAATDMQVVMDDRSGLVFQIAQYSGYGMNMLDVTVRYGIKVWKPEFVAILLG
jgi:hypothetical protein